MDEMNKKILIVDDEPKNLKILRIRLEKDYELFEASGGNDALEKVISFKPALVLLDVMMPDLDGFSVCEKIKSNPDLEGVKVILLTGRGTIEEKLEGYKKGADDYMVKPFNGEELKAKVKVFMKLHNLEKGLKRQSLALSHEVEHKNEKLFEAERLAYLGINTAEIIHNLKNPLSIIKMLATRYQKGKAPEDFTEKLISNIDKTFEIIKTVMGNSRGTNSTGDLETFDLNALIENELDFIKFNSNFKYKVALETDFKAKNHVFGNRGHFQQVIGNILKNAAEALEESEEKVIKIFTLDQDSCLEMHITDTGPGIAPEHREKIFESNFSTKVNSDDPLSGTGIGLAYCKKIIESYGGSIKVNSELGKGTTFILTFWSKSPHNELEQVG